MLCVPHQFVHTNQIYENQYHSYDISTLSINNFEYMLSVYICFTMWKRCSRLLANRLSLMKVLIFPDLFLYMEYIIFLGIIDNRSFPLLSRLYRLYDAHAISNKPNKTEHLDLVNWTFKCHIHIPHICYYKNIMRCFYRFGMYAAHALYIRSPYTVESCWSPRARGMYAMHASLALWICNGQVLICNIIRSGIAIHAPNAPHVRHPCAIDTQLVCNTYETVAPEMFHQTISAMLQCMYLFIFSNAVWAQWRLRPVEQGLYTVAPLKFANGWVISSQTL